MKIFLSYSSHDRVKADEIALALQGAGHDVFFDRSGLSAGDDFHSVIRERIDSADLFIFLISPNSLSRGSYALSELTMAREKWRHPRGHVLPVLLVPTPMEDVPAYLRSVTIFETEGNVAAELAARLSRKQRIRPLFTAALAALVLILFVLLGPKVRDILWNGQEQTVQIAKSDFTSRVVFDPEWIERTEYQFDGTSRFPPDREDLVRLGRVAFGTILDTSAAFSIEVIIRNTVDRPIQLDLTRRFFELEDDQGREGDLLYFCCETSGEVLGPEQERTVQLIFRSHPGWQGKELSARMLFFRIQGLLPLLRGTWEFPPLATAD